MGGRKGGLGMKGTTIGQILVGMEQGKYKKGTKFTNSNNRKFIIIAEWDKGLVLAEDGHMGDFIWARVDNDLWYETDEKGNILEDKGV